MIPGGLNTMMMSMTSTSPVRTARSLRLSAAAQASLSRTPLIAGDRKTFTFSAFLKRGALGTFQGLLSGGNSSFGFHNTDTFFFSNAGQGTMESRALFRDPSAPMHVMFSYDSTQLVQVDRLKLFVNGASIAFASSFIAQFAEADINNTIETVIGYTMVSGDRSYADMVISEVYFLDGLALLPFAFAETDSATGMWIPKDYVGPYGTNGFYLNFSNNSAATTLTLGKDYSGNDNDLTPTNISVGLLGRSDSLIDVAINYADGGNGRGNYPSLNPLSAQSTVKLSDANLTVSGTSPGTCTATMPVDSGKRYLELTLVSFDRSVGLGFTSTPMEQSAMENKNGKFWIADSGSFYIVAEMVIASYPARMATGQVWQLAIDSEAGKAWIGVDNVWLDSKNNESGSLDANENPTFKFLAGTVMWPMVVSGSSLATINFGQTPFQYPPPPGFVAINTQNLPKPVIPFPHHYFDIRLRIGTGEPGVVSDFPRGPDFVWSKCRGTRAAHVIYDIARGPEKALTTSDYSAQTTEKNGLTEFIDHGYGFGSNAPPDVFDFNLRGQAYVDWSWVMGNVPGFDLVLYKGGLEPGSTIEHGLGMVPAVIMSRAYESGGDWPMFHQALAARHTLYMSMPTASSEALDRYDPSGFTASVFKLGLETENNELDAEQIAYLWSEIAGFSHFGSYIGNGSSNGPFVWCGFRPRIIFRKNATARGSWLIHDSARDPVNLAIAYLKPNVWQEEGTDSDQVDLLSNGFKIRSNYSESNASGDTYVFMAFAESSFKFARAR